MNKLLLVVLFSHVFSATSGFSAPIFANPATDKLQRTAPSQNDGVEIEMPDFDELFGRIQLVSPLARLVVEEDGGPPDARGFAAVDDSSERNGLTWKQLESKPKKLVHLVEKIDNFQNLGCPILRCRARMEGPIVFSAFGDFIMDFDHRAEWDPSIDEVFEIYPIGDLDMANVLMGFGKYGDCGRLGVGYCRTKNYLAVPGREQLTLCGIQNFPDGSMVIWGTEMEEWHNHLLPTDFERTVRAKTHLFSITLVPTSHDAFDVEYCLQIESNFPNWITTPILTESIKAMFRYGKEFYAGDKIQHYVAEEKCMDHLRDRNSILMTP